jgi:hypothetical protein
MGCKYNTKPGPHQLCDASWCNTCSIAKTSKKVSPVVRRGNHPEGLFPTNSETRNK